MHNIISEDKDNKLTSETNGCYLKLCTGKAKLKISVFQVTGLKNLGRVGTHIFWKIKAPQALRNTPPLLGAPKVML